MSYFSVTQLLDKRTEEAWWHALHSLQVISPQVIKSQIHLLSVLLQFNDYFTTVPFRSLKKQAGSEEGTGGEGLIEGKTTRAVPEGRPASRSFLTFT